LTINQSCTKLQLSVNRQREPEYSAKCIEWADSRMKSVAITQTVKSLVGALTLT